MVKTKYKLMANTGDGPKPCAFFASEAGCRNSANCKFSHELTNDNSNRSNKTPPSVESSSVVSSESSDDSSSTEEQETPPPPKQKIDNKTAKLIRQPHKEMKKEQWKVTGDQKVCAFFNSKVGCKNGTSCKFIHEQQELPKTCIDTLSVAVTEKLSKKEKKAKTILEQNLQEQNNLKKLLQQQQEELKLLKNKVAEERRQQKEEGELMLLQNKVKEERRKVEEEKQNFKKIATHIESTTKKTVKRKNSHNSQGNSIFASPNSSVKKARDQPQVVTKCSESESEENPCSISVFKTMANVESDEVTTGDDYLNQDLGLAYLEKLRSNSVIPTPITTSYMKRPKTHHNGQTNAITRQALNIPNFRSLNLPVAPFSIAEKNSPKKTTFRDAKARDVKARDINTIILPCPIPKNTPEGISYIPLLHASREHPRYKSQYNLSKYKHSDPTNVSKWVKTRPYGDWCRDNPPIVAIDCEMCQTKDPVSGKMDGKALCRISVVNALDTSEVLLDTLVKPDFPVVDYRARINGIEREDLNGVQFTLRHAQAFMQALCCEETVIVGHALYNDLETLKMEHYCNVDSSYLFRVKGDQSEDKASVPSLKDCATCILGEDMPLTHDSVNDAIVSLKCCIHYLEKNGQVGEVIRTPRKIPRKSVSNNMNEHGTDCLFVHRLPKTGCTASDISNLFLLHCKIQPEEVETIEYGSFSGKAYVRFKNAHLCNLAFGELESKPKSDKSGKLQKKVYMRDGNYIQVRQMTVTNK